MGTPCVFCIDELLEACPEAVFVLDVDKWVES
jgi:hypothetical protein